MLVSSLCGNKASAKATKPIVLQVFTKAVLLTNTVARKAVLTHFKNQLPCWPKTSYVFISCTVYF